METFWGVHDIKMSANVCVCKTALFNIGGRFSTKFPKFPSKTTGSKGQAKPQTKM